MPAMLVEPGNCGPSEAHDHDNPGCFPFNKNSSFKFRKFRVLHGTVHSGCTDPIQATIRLVIILVSRIQKSGTGDNNFVKRKGTFRSDWPKWPDWSKRTTLKAGPKYSGWTKPKWSVPFDVPTKISGILGWMESAPCEWHPPRQHLKANQWSLLTGYSGTPPHGHLGNTVTLLLRTVFSSLAKKPYIF